MTDLEKISYSGVDDDKIAVQTDDIDGELMKSVVEDLR
jgi:hypothetical protein